jgi:Multidrug resistance efflux pump
MEQKPDSIKTPQSMESAMTVIDIKAWIAILTVLLALAAMAIWAFFGTMRINVTVNGALVRSGKVIEIYSDESARILDIAVSRNQELTADQVIARLEQPDLVNQINLMIATGESEEAIAAARKNLLKRTRILTGGEGRVQDIYVRQGDYVSKGTRIATLLQNPEKSQALACLIYVPISSIGKIKAGMEVNVFPAFADKNEYGSMLGTVEAIGEYPVTAMHMYERYGSEELAASFMQDTVYEVTVSLLSDIDNPTGYKWTISKGPDAKIGDLSLCTAAIVQKEVRPIDVFFFNKY